MADVQETGGAAASDMWDDDKWHRYGLLAGVLFVALQVASFVAAGFAPARDANLIEIVDYFHDNETGIQVASILTAFAVIVGLWWLGSLWRVIGRLEPNGPRLAFIAVAGFITAGASVGGAQSMFAAMAIRPNASFAEFSWTVGYVMVSFALAAVAVFALAVGALALWTKFVPTWLGYLAFVTFICCLVASVGAGTAKSFTTIFEIAGFVLLLVWVLFASLSMYRSNAGVSTS